MTNVRRQPLPAGEYPVADDDAARADRPVQAEHLGRARSARTRVLLEDYVELIADLGTDGAAVGPTALARHLGVSHATVIKCVARLGREGLATSQPYRGVSLTEAGLALAAGGSAPAPGGGSPAPGRRRSGSGCGV